MVLELPPAEASAKARIGDPIDEPENVAGPWWAAVVPISACFEMWVLSADYTGAVPPESISDLAAAAPTTGRPSSPPANRAALMTLLCSHCSVMRC